MPAAGVTDWHGKGPGQDRAEVGELREGPAPSPGTKGKMLARSEGDLQYLEIMGQDKNMAPAEDFLMRDRLLGEGKNYFLIASAYFTYVMSQTLCGQITVWEGFGVRDSCASGLYRKQYYPGRESRVEKPNNVCRNQGVTNPRGPFASSLQGSVGQKLGRHWEHNSYPD